jgi:alkylation response protein AidB-like acyl-CoA dehydrogenase
LDFHFTDEQQQLRRSVREFAEGEIASHVMEWDEASHFPLEIIPKLGEMGLLGIIFPEQYGGRDWVTPSMSSRSKSWPA